MSLPEPWIEKIFHKLAVTYGRAWLSMWDGVPIDDVKADWADQLTGYQQNPSAIAYALDNLPAAKPPTVLEFRAICQRGPTRNVEQPRLPYTGPTIDAKAVQAAIDTARQSKPKRAPRQWAHDLAEKDRVNPKTVTPAVRAIYQAVVGGGA